MSGNRISCPGDKAGDGEAIVFDGNGNTFGFEAAPTVDAAGPGWLRIHRSLLPQQSGRAIPDNYYDGFWLSIVAGPGQGQTRRIVSYTEDRATGFVTLRIAPDWDTRPERG